MLDETTTTSVDRPNRDDADPTLDPTPAPRRRRAASRPAGPPAAAPPPEADAAVLDTPPDTPAARKRTSKKTAAKSAPTAAAATAPDPTAPAPSDEAAAAPVGKKGVKKAATKKTAAKKSSRKAAAAPDPIEATAQAAPTDELVVGSEHGAETDSPPETAAAARPTRSRTRKKSAAPAVEPTEAVDPDSSATPAIAVPVLFQAPDPTATPPRRSRKAAPSAAPADQADVESVPTFGVTTDTGPGADDGSDDDADDDSGTGPRRRRRRGGRGRRGRATDDSGQLDDSLAPTDTGSSEADDDDDRHAPQDRDDREDEDGGTHRRRRRRRRGGGGDAAEMAPDDPPNTVVKVREPRARERGGEVTGLKGSTRLEAKKQRRREGREAGRRRAPIITEAEFLARREAVERVMIVRQTGDRTQIAVLEDDVLVEHYVTRSSSQSFAGNVYLGRVQNVLPSMEAAFVDIGRGRNAVLYAGEVNWDAAGLDGQPKRIEHALKSGESVLVQVTKDPMGHKGARLTSQISLPGRFLVYVPDGAMTGISRKLPDTERTRLKQILKQVLPENAGVIVRTASEGSTEEQLSRDVTRLQAQWEDIQKKAKTASAPALLYSEPDLTVRVIRDVFNEDFTKVVVSGDDAWDVVEAYVGHVAPDLADRIERWTSENDVFAAHRIDEQLSKALDRKVWLPSGGSLVIDRTEAMVVVDVNTGKFTGKGGNLEETVTKNNLEAAEEIVHQLRLRDLGGIIVIDFIDMVLESNRDLVLRRLLECLGRDRTKHQVAEVTSLGLVQMTRKRVGQGLLEAFSEPCEVCNGRGILVHMEPVDPKPTSDHQDRGDRADRSDRAERSGDRRKKGGRGKKASDDAAKDPEPATA